jgi:4-amino-4-deoxy-L-arabinose transferase-like glycosyltransferase
MGRLTLKQEKILLVVLALLGAALGIRWIAILQNEVIANDAILYIKSAKLYSVGAYEEGFKVFPRSTFPLLIAFAQRFIGDWVSAGQWVSTFFGTLAVVPFYFLAQGMFGGKIAIVSSIFYVICPSLVQNSAEVLRDTPFVFFYVTALWLGYEGIRKKRAEIMGLAGLFILLCASLKDYGLMLFFSLLLFLCWSVVKRQITLRKALILCSGFLASAIVVLTFIGILLDYKRFNMQAPIVSRAKTALTGITRQRAVMSTLKGDIERSELSPQGKRFLDMTIRHRFAVYFFDIMSKTIHAFSVILLVFFIFGVMKRYIIPYQPEEFLLLTIYVTYIPVFFVLLNFSNYLQTKNIFPILVPSLIWSGVGFEECLGKIKKWMQKSFFPFKEWGLRRIGLLMIVLTIIAMLFMGLKPQRKDKLEFKEIGSWLKNNGYASSIILGRAELRRLAFYAESEFIPIPKGSYEDIIRFARKKKVNLLVVDREVMERGSPNFLDEVSSRDLKPIHMAEIKDPKDPLMVFRVLD